MFWYCSVSFSYMFLLFVTQIVPFQLDWVQSFLFYIYFSLSLHYFFIMILFNPTWSYLWLNKTSQGIEVNKNSTSYTSVVSPSKTKKKTKKKQKKKKKKEKKNKERVWGQTTFQCIESFFFILTFSVYLYLYFFLTLVLLNPDIPSLCKQCRSRKMTSVEAIWSGFTQFDIKYQILYQQPGSSKLIGWELGGRGILIYSAWQGLRNTKYFRHDFTWVLDLFAWAVEWR